MCVPFQTTYRRRMVFVKVLKVVDFENVHFKFSEMFWNFLEDSRNFWKTFWNFRNVLRLSRTFCKIRVISTFWTMLLKHSRPSENVLNCLELLGKCKKFLESYWNLLKHSSLWNEINTVLLHYLFLFSIWMASYCSWFCYMFFNRLDHLPCIKWTSQRRPAKCAVHWSVVGKRTAYRCICSSTRTMRDNEPSRPKEPGPNLDTPRLLNCPTVNLEQRRVRG